MYLVFVGQLHTTCGTPHEITGRYNTYGDLMAFKTRKERYDNFSPKGFETCVKTNKQHAKRTYFAGCSKKLFNEYLSSLDFE